jgi:GNAT superfamily N-acetyltransferase
VAAPLLLQSSADPQDTRPGTSGRIPSTHFNVPLYQHVPTQTPDPVMGGFLNVLSGGAASNPGAAGAYWKGVAQSFNPTTFEGAANLASNLFPGNLHSGLVPKELPSSVPGITITRAAKPSDWVFDYRGTSAPYSPKFPSERGMRGMNKGTADIAYNAHDWRGNLVGSIVGSMSRHTTHIESVYVDPKYRNTRLAHDLMRPVLQRGKPVHATVVNPKLGALIRRMAEKNPKLSEVWSPPPEDRSGWPGEPPDLTG